MTCHLELSPKGKVPQQGTPFTECHFQRAARGLEEETHSPNGTSNNGIYMGRTSSKAPKTAPELVFGGGGADKDPLQLSFVSNFIRNYLRIIE